MPNYAVNNLTAPDNYSSASQLGPMDRIDHVNLDVSNSGIFWQYMETRANLAQGPEGDWGSEVYMSPGSRTLTRPGMVAIRFRAAVPAASLPAGQIQAQVTMEVVQA